MPDKVHPVNSILNVGTEPSTIRGDILEVGLLKSTETITQPSLNSATSQKISADGKLSLQVRISDCQVRADFGALRNLVIPILLRAFALKGLWTVTSDPSGA